MDSSLRWNDEDKNRHSGTGNGPPKADKLFDQNKQNGLSEAKKAVRATNVGLLA